MTASTSSPDPPRPAKAPRTPPRGPPRLAPNDSYSTADDGGAGFPSWAVTSSFGNGFSASGGVSETTGAPLGLTFMFDATATLSIVLDSDSTPSDAGRSFFFEEAGVGGIGFFEPNLLSSRFTRNPSAINGNSFTVRFAREDGGIDPGTTVVPLPGPLGLLFGALAGLGWVLRRRTA